MWLKTRLRFKGEVRETDECPACHSNWRGGDIFSVLREQAWTADKTDDELRKLVKESYAPPYEFCRVIGIEYGYGDYRRRDGVSAWQCPDCNKRFPRDLGAHTLSESEV